MHNIRTNLFRTFLGGILLVPLFAFAQLTTFDQQAQSPDSISPQELGQIIDGNNSSAPTASELQQKALVDYLNVVSTPENPGPNESVSITVESYLTDLNKATLRWVLNGKTMLSGVGKTSFDFQNGSTGSRTNLTIYITTSTGESIQKSLSWSPLGVSVLWEASTYTPPFYRGKALASPESHIRAVAIPDNTKAQDALGAGNLAYAWEEDGTGSTASSGYRKNSFRFSAPIPFGTKNLNVVVSSLDDSFKSEKGFTLPVTNPFILFYENLPLLGTWYNNPLASTINLGKKELSVSAEPYFFSKEESDDTPTLSYSWLVNDSPVKSFTRNIILRNDNATKGDSVVSLSMSDTQKTFQASTNSLNIHFGDNGERPSF